MDHGHGHGEGSSNAEAGWPRGAAGKRIGADAWSHDPRADVLTGFSELTD